MAQRSFRRVDEIVVVVVAAVAATLNFVKFHLSLKRLNVI